MPTREDATRLRVAAQLPPRGRLATSDLCRLLPHAGLDLARPRLLEPPWLGYLFRNELTIGLGLSDEQQRATLAWGIALAVLDQGPSLITLSPEQYASAREIDSRPGRVAELSGWVLAGHVRIHDLRALSNDDLIGLLGIRGMLALGWRELAIEAHRQRHLWAARAV